ncbi:RNA-dependent RNA polymerase 1 [Araneus ventricosus]|uniref:RNA-dependent RNA polymerase n=1 Tax=Araneus ventricosus TaxID=182803 RepID=A0A4Y2DPF0_ARAVE|nr:RNA-dependent RNA polymerase 1 [Araneus ventricosus]
MDDGRSMSEFVSEAANFFNNLQQDKFNHSVVTEEVKQCYNEFNCDSDLYEIGFTVICKNVRKTSDIESFASSISKKWCDSARNNQYLHWLLPERGNSFSLNHKSHCGEAKASEFAFGTIPDMKNFVQCYAFCQRGSSSSILCSFSHLQRHFILYISNKHKNDCTHTGEMGHKMRIEYDSLLRIIADVDPSKPAAELFLHMEHPPLIYVTHANKKESTPDNISLEDSVALSRRISKAKEMQYSFDKFERTFNLGCTCNYTFCDSRLKIGKSPVLKIVIKDKFQARWLINQLILRHAKKTEICISSMNTVKIHDSLKDFKKFPLFSSGPRSADSADQFNCEYAWRSLNSKSLFIFHQITLKCQHVSNYIRDLKHELAHCASKNPDAVAKALFDLSDMVDKGMMFIFHSVFKKKFNYFCDFIELNKLPKGMCYVRRVIITPSKVIFLRPYEHFDNRIIRKFGVEYMLRVSVQDDNFEKLTYAVQYNSQKESIMAQVASKILNSGIVIGSRNYEVLACSSSQLREHGLWLYAEDTNGNTAATIRKWMGDFSEINNVPKYMARMGQCLSTTEEGVQVSLDAGSEDPLEEIKTSNGRYIFSDGIGMISVDLANEVRAVLKKNRGVDENEALFYQPSAFQIRYKGCKGMVAEYPKLQGRAIGIRPSMNKFKCKTSDQLEIVKTSAPRKLFLNKHLITILEQMGIPKETFLDLQSDMMLNLLDSLMIEDRAASLLTQTLQMDFPFEDLHKAGFSLTNEPFFRSLLLSVFKSYSAKLQSSMRIAIPEKYGRNMLGVLDETGSLKYGEVFVQYSVSTTYPNSPVKVLKGSVIVTKNPCLHPGDVRKLTAVDVKALHHIKDCIVFPAEGKRPHPDEMAGSDLDGDEFVILWHPKLIFKRKHFKAMDYPVYEETFISHKIELKDMVNFFCEYIQNDCIGSFANAHLMWADYLRDGIFSRKCMNIAKQYPYVLDFAKHGTTKYLKKSERPDQYPDFMQKGLTANTYYSKRALGSLYRSSRVLDACSSKISLPDFSRLDTSSFDSDLMYLGWEQFESSAEKHKQKYTNMVNEILHRYGISTEAEAFTGFVDLKFAKKWRQERSDAVKVIKSYMRNIMQMFRYIFLKEVQEDIENDDSDAEIKKYQRASAWYMVVYGKAKKTALSFPWVLSDVLIKIKLNKNAQTIEKSNFLHDIDSDIQSCVSSGVIKCNIFDSSETCACRYLSESILFKWLSHSKLNIGSTEEQLACKSCFDRVISYFWSSSNVYCCSSPNKNACKCSDICSPTELILKFLKFFIKKTNSTIGKCDDDCDGFIARNLQELSLQTLSYLAITRNIYYLGLNFKTENFTRNVCLEEDSTDLLEEGSPLKIPVKTEVLKNVIENYRDEVISYLEKNSGVHHIVLQPDSDLHDNLCIIVNSLGKTWQRWNLEEILLDPDFTNKILCALNIDGSVHN